MEPSPAPSWLGRYGGTLVAGAAFCLGLLWSFRIPPLNAPDETSHLMAVMQVRKEHRIPVLTFDFSKDPAGTVVTVPDPDVVAYAARSGVTDPYCLLPMECIQPPFYYLLAGGLSHVVTPEPQKVLRISRTVTVLLGALAVWFIWAAAREFAPEHPLWALEVAGLVAFLPQFCFNIACVTNDSAINLVAAASFYVWIKGLRTPTFDPFLVRAGALFGLGMLCKLGVLALAPALALVLSFRVFQGLPALRDLRRFWIEDRPQFRRTALLGLRRAATMAAGSGGAALLVCGGWILRNCFVYGEPMGLEDFVRYHQTRHLLLRFDDSFRVGWFLDMTWQSFWGRFGWMDRPLTVRFYEQASVATLILFALSGAAVVAAILRNRRPAAPKSPPPKAIPLHAGQAAAAMALVIITLAYLFIKFSREVSFQPQGRYFFPALLPLALAFTGGLYVLSRLPRPRILGVASLLLWMLYWNVQGLFTVTA